MEETAVYQRTTGMHYLVRNPQREMKGNIAIIVPALEIFFKPNGPRDPRGEFDPMHAAREYVKQEASAGLIDVMDKEKQAKRTQDLYKFFCEWIEAHPDFNMYITKKPGREQIKVQLENTKKALEAQIAELDGKIESAEPMIDEIPEEELPEEAPLVTGGGVVAGPATMRTARGRPPKNKQEIVSEG